MGNVQETKTFTGGMNTDDAPEYVGQTEYQKAYNMRYSGTESGESGYLTSIERNELITPNGQLNSGIYKTIGVGRFENIRKAYEIKYNSLGFHQIVEFDYDTLVETVRFIDLTNTGGVQIFNLNPDSYFNRLSLLHEKFLIMTDGVSGLVYCINIERLISGGYGSVITQEDFNLYKNPSETPVKAEYVDDPNKNANLLKGKLFQFRVQNEYYDFMKSAWSTISKRPIPEKEITDAVGDDPTKLNGIKLRVNIGNELVKKITIATRNSLFDWYKIATKDRSYITALPDTDIDLSQEISEAYNPVTNEYIFVFYNEGAMEAIPATDTDEPYDNIPENVGALEVVNGDILALADLTEGFDRPDTMKLDVSVATYLPQIDTSITEPRNFSTATDQFRITGGLFGGSHKRFVTINFYGNVKAGDEIRFNFADIRNPSVITSTITYTATLADEGSMSVFIDNIYNRMPNNTEGGLRKQKKVVSPTEGRVGFVTDSYIQLQGIVPVLEQSGDVEGITLNTVKSNTSYQLALAHYKNGKYYPITTDDTYAVTTPSYAITNGLLPQIGWNLTGTPPQGATSYQILLSENTKYQKTLYVTGKYSPADSKDDFIAFNLFSLDRYKDGAGIVAYDFADGDRVTFVHTFEGTSTPIKWFDNPPLDFAVASFELRSEEVSSVMLTRYILKIKKSSLVNVATDLDGKQILLEIYSPKKNNNSLDSKVFYEIGEQFPIVNGAYTTTSGTIVQADSYFRPRSFISSTDLSNTIYVLGVEDFNFSDEYESKFWSNGRGRTYNDEIGRTRRKADIRYSRQFKFGSLTNEINRFYANNVYGDTGGQTSSLYGAITALIMRQNILIALQELNVAHIPVYTSLLEDASGNATVTISDRLFSNVRYMTANMGTGLAKNAISQSSNGTVYFVDHNNGYPCKDGYNGLSVINVKNEKYFSEKIKNSKANDIITFFDDFNKEFTITFLAEDGNIEVIDFSDENQWEYKDDYTLTVDDVTLIQPDNGTLTVDAPDLVYTPDNGYSGADSFAITFVDGTVIVKNGCVTVVEGQTSVQEFSFIPLIDQELSTLLESINSVIVTDNTIAVPISIVDGEYRINGGAWTSASGTVNVNDVVDVRRTSSASNGVTVGTTLTISDKSATFNITTIDELPPVDDLIVTLTGYGADNGANREYGFTLTTPQSIIGAISVTFSCSYDGGVYGSTIILNSGDTVVDTGFVIFNGTLGGNINSLIRTASTPPNGSTVTLTIGGTKTIVYNVSF